MAVKYCNLLIINALHTSTVGTGFIPVLAAAGQQLGIINTNSTLIINVLHTSTVGAASDKSCDFVIMQIEKS